MLEENRISFDDMQGEVSERVIYVEWTCPKCKNSMILTQDNWDNHSVVDTHNPNHEAIECCVCGEQQELFGSSVEVSVVGTKSRGYMSTDGSYVYVKVDGEVVRLT